MLEYLNYTLIQQASQCKLNTENNIKQLILVDKSKGISNQNRQFIINKSLPQQLCPQAALNAFKLQQCVENRVMLEVPCFHQFQPDFKVLMEASYFDTENSVFSPTLNSHHATVLSCFWTLHLLIANCCGQDVRPVTDPNPKGRKTAQQPHLSQQCFKVLWKTATIMQSLCGHYQLGLVHLPPSFLSVTKMI